MSNMTHMYKIVLATLFHHFSKSIAIISTNRKTSSIAIVGGGLSGEKKPLVMLHI